MQNKLKRIIKLAKDVISGKTKSIDISHLSEEELKKMCRKSKRK